MFTNALDAADTELTRTAAKGFMVGAIRRTFEPGCPHDWLTVLVGAPKGWEKVEILPKPCCRQPLNCPCLPRTWT